MKKQNQISQSSPVDKQKREAKNGSLNPQMTGSNSLDLDTYVREINLQEQNYYWQRFSAFATLHAGLFVLATSDSITNRLPIYIIGIILAVAWVFIQWASLFYVERIKPFFFNRLETKGVRLRRHWLFSEFKLSSTRIGVAVTVLIFLLWLIMLISHIT